MERRGSTYAAVHSKRGSRPHPALNAGGVGPRDCQTTWDTPPAKARSRESRVKVSEEIIVL